MQINTVQFFYFNEQVHKDIIIPYSEKQHSTACNEVLSREKKRHTELWQTFISLIRVWKKKSLAIKFLFSLEGHSFYLSMDGNMVKTQLEIEAGVTEEKFFSHSRSLFHPNSFSWLLPSITWWLSLTQSGKREQRDRRDKLWNHW